MKKIIIGIIVVLFIGIISSLVGLYFIGDKIIEAAVIGDVDEFLNDSDVNKVGESAKPDLSADKNQITKDDKNNVAVTSVPTSNESKRRNEVITADKLKEANKKIPKTEKVEVAATAIKNLDMDQISEIKNMASGGFTEAEKEKAKGIIYKSYSPAEIARIKELYRKYNN